MKVFYAPLLCTCGGSFTFLGPGIGTVVLKCQKCEEVIVIKHDKLDDFAADVITVKPKNGKDGEETISETVKKKTRKKPN